MNIKEKIIAKRADYWSHIPCISSGGKILDIVVVTDRMQGDSMYLIHRRNVNVTEGTLYVPKFRTSAKIDDGIIEEHIIEQALSSETTKSVLRHGDKLIQISIEWKPYIIKTLHADFEICDYKKAVKFVQDHNGDARDDITLPEKLILTERRRQKKPESIFTEIIKHNVINDIEDSSNDENDEEDLNNENEISKINEDADNSEKDIFKPRASLIEYNLYTTIKDMNTQIGVLNNKVDSLMAENVVLKSTIDVFWKEMRQGLINLNNLNKNNLSKPTMKVSSSIVVNEPATSIKTPIKRKLEFELKLPLASDIDIYELNNCLDRKQIAYNQDTAESLKSYLGIICLRSRIPKNVFSEIFEESISEKITFKQLQKTVLYKFIIEYIMEKYPIEKLAVVGKKSEWDLLDNTEKYHQTFHRWWTSKRAKTKKHSINVYDVSKKKKHNKCVQDEKDENRQVQGEKDENDHVQDEKDEFDDDVQYEKGENENEDNGINLLNINITQSEDKFNNSMIYEIA